ncbi:tRNA lysidine(34) synthetase TilS [Rhodospirillum centenum]|uniref:tRNA(Ile)-lysidine synthase n=1 Tax=Rhodospirillum centenum (strain ATCC 51521 / SW) TaxID=414684 RepID=B6ITH6_RHOCS|nr:tRNA lysidine(34) synthetase TilS [Rhodospirillum centenum]ACI99194.1 tRNA(Ile)-lysidine synthetase, TilS, putative [Rhodospirillum centenum SW]
MRLTEPQQGAPVAAAEFAARMAALGSFEARPLLAVGVSGGRDSLALVLLADAWARARGGSVLALTVDHALRPESAAEAAQVGAWMAARGIRHAVLRWEGQKPSGGVQQAARAARYALLEARCRAEGALHLLLGHQREDQAETVLLRAARSSGPDGLAGMAAVRELAGLRLLRPLLDIPRVRLAATCEALGQPWLDDPSNLSDRFARGRLRRAGAAGTEEPWQRALAAGRTRAALDDAAAAVLAGQAALYPEGWGEVAAAALCDPPEDVARRVLLRLLQVVGGAALPPRSARLDRLLAALRRSGAAGSGGGGDKEGTALSRGATLHGCLVVPSRAGWRILREPRAVSPPVEVVSGASVLWDGRFRIAWNGAGSVTVGALGEGAAALPSDGSPRLPALVRRTLPALRRDGRVLCVPHLWGIDTDADPVPCRVRFQPPEAASGPRFSVVWADTRII